jgi:hypothetical protein
MPDRAEVIRQVTELLLAKARQQQAAPADAPADGADGGGFDEAAVVAAIEAALAEILAGFEGDLSEIPADDLAQVIDEYVGLAIDEVA